jgi:hypothetical protein
MSRGLAQKKRVQKKLEEPLYRAKTGFVAGDLADFQSVRDFLSKGPGKKPV